MIHQRGTSSQWIATLVGIYNTASTINTGKRIIAWFSKYDASAAAIALIPRAGPASFPFPPGSYNDSRLVAAARSIEGTCIGKVASVATGGRRRAASSAVSAWRTCDPSRSKSHEKRRIVSWPVIRSRTRLINAR